MSKSSVFGALLIVVIMLGSELAIAQKSSRVTSEEQPACINTSALTKEFLQAIQDIEDRTVAVAEDFPDDLYNTYRPKGNEEVRTAAQILLHIAEQNQSAAQLIRTKQQEEALIAAGKKPRAEDILTYVSKEDTVKKVKASFAAVREAIQGNSDDPKKLEWWLYVIAHSNGHFGNLVTYYRNNGLEPPTSRQ